MKTHMKTKTARFVGFLLPLMLLAALAALLTGGAPKPAVQATVYVFLSTQCPVSKVYAPRLNALAQNYGKRGVVVTGVFSNMQEGQAEVTAYAKSRGFLFPTVWDGDASLVAKYGATMTPQAFVVDPLGKVVYQGRIDDNADTTQVKHRDLRDALEAVLAGRAVAQAKTAAFGCIIRRPAAEVVSSQITYCRDVAPILQRQCQTCHRAGEIGPMALTSYSQAAAWRGDIKRYTQNRVMPPWKADPGAGDFQDARRLSGAEIATLAKWADSGAPEGDPKDLPPPAHFTEGGWPLGKPDMVLATGPALPCGRGWAGCIPLLCAADGFHP